MARLHDIESFLSLVRAPALDPKVKVDASHMAAAMTLLGIHDHTQTVSRKELCIVLARYAYAAWRAL